MRELSLFTGAGGGLQGTALLGWQPIGYVEWNDYCQQSVAARIRDRILPNAPIFGDIRAFINQGFANAYQGLVDVITAGFPCQPFSNAGCRHGVNDERNRWPETLECLRIIRPRFALLENVTGLLAPHRNFPAYISEILGQLSEIGFDAEWDVFSACAFGAPHTRERVFILAYANGERCRGRWECERGRTVSSRPETQERSAHQPSRQLSLQTSVWSSTNIGDIRVPDGMGAKVERVRAAGNGQVPVVVAAAWHHLSQRIFIEGTQKTS